MALTPAVDIFERGDTTVLIADMPGVAPEGYRRLSAEFNSGVLRFEPPRSAEAKPRKISVKAA